MRLASRCLHTREIGWVVLCSLVLVACSSPHTSASTSTARVTVSSPLAPSVTRWLVLGEKGTGQEFVSEYRSRSETGRAYSIVFAQAPAVHSVSPVPRGEFLYRTSALGSTFELLQAATGDYVCVRLRGKAWRCAGPPPSGFYGNGLILSVMSFDLESPYYLGMVPHPPPTGSRVVRRMSEGRTVSCLLVATRPVETFCLTEAGILALREGADVPLELKSLSLRLPKAEFGLPVAPRPWPKPTPKKPYCGIPFCVAHDLGMPAKAWLGSRGVG